MCLEIAAGLLRRFDPSGVQIVTRDQFPVPCGPVNSVAEVFEDPQIRAQEMVLEVDHPGHGLVRMLGFPIKLSETPCRVRRSVCRRISGFRSQPRSTS